MGKQCCSDKTCCESNRPATPYSSRTTLPSGLCIAVVSEDEDSLVVFDAAGTPRRYLIPSSEGIKSAQVVLSRTFMHGQE